VLAVNPVTQMFKTQDKNPEPPRTRPIPLEYVGPVWNFLRDDCGGLHADFASALMLKLPLGPLAVERRTRAWLKAEPSASSWDPVVIELSTLLAIFSK
jgi:hypothetical protein